MYTCRRTFSPSAAKAAFALGALSWFCLSQSAAFAALPITPLASFGNGSGAYPFGGVILDGSGNLFGTTKQGGVNSYGTVYKIASGTHAFTSLASFNYTNGDTPYGGVVLDSKGNLFGTTNGGGAYNRGTVFEIAGAASPVPETSQVTSLTLMLAGLIALAFSARRREGADSSKL